MKKIILKLISLANSLDQKGHYKAAGTLDEINSSLVKSAAFDDPWFQTPFSTKKYKAITESDDLQELKDFYNSLGSMDEKKNFLYSIESMIEESHESGQPAPPKYIEQWLYNTLDNLDGDNDDLKRQEAIKMGGELEKELHQLLKPIAQQLDISDEDFAEIMSWNTAESIGESLFDNYLRKNEFNANEVIKERAAGAEEHMRDLAQDEAKHQEAKNNWMWPEKKQLEYRDPSEIEEGQFGNPWS